MEEEEWGCLPSQRPCAAIATPRTRFCTEDRLTPRKTCAREHARHTAEDICMRCSELSELST
eukprot:10469030-Alexandrium_andersonii.AAC.1